MEIDVQFIFKFIVVAGIIIFYSVGAWFDYKRGDLCRKEGHILRVNYSGFKVPLSDYSSCVRCGVPLHNLFGGIKKIKGWEDYPHQYDGDI